jgi:hypothetical protein
VFATEGVLEIFDGPADLASRFGSMAGVLQGFAFEEQCFAHIRAVPTGPRHTLRKRQRFGRIGLRLRVVMFEKRESCERRQ